MPDDPIIRAVLGVIAAWIIIAVGAIVGDLLGWF